jgi:hypothetical protein
MHPSPCRPTADRQTRHQQGTSPKDTGPESLIHPSPNEDAQQGWHHDGPTENANLRQMTGESWLAFALRLLVARDPLPN